MAKAQGQFTLIDLNDAVTLTGFISSNLSKTQMYNPDNGTYNPDWKTTSGNLVLTPSLFVRGSSEDVIASSAVQSVEWYLGTATTPIESGGNYEINENTHALKVKANVMEGKPGVDFRCIVSYLDSTTDLVVAHAMVISFSRVVNGAGITALDVTTPNGNIFKNGSIGSLPVKAELWRGNIIDTDMVSYQWYKMDPSATTDQGGGIGWAAISGATSNTYTVNASDVDSYATFKCVATDTDTTSATKDQKFENVASFVDMNDPIYVEISSTAGDTFMNGEGTTKLTAHVYQAGEEITPSSYSWSRYGRFGALEQEGFATTKDITVEADTINKTATFVCDVEV